ncbi:MAG TPA: SPFH domain-containing protein [Terriglobia bacterium]|nr:SPFH domain-containing protein [Terriglobia bacterium]
MFRFAVTAISLLVACLGMVAGVHPQGAASPGAPGIPSEAVRYLNRGAIEARQGKDAQAIADLERSIALNPNDFRPYKELDGVLSRNRQYDTAVRYWTQYIQLHPGDGRAFCERAGAYSWLKDSEHTLEDAEKACSLGAQSCCQFVQRAGANQAARPVPRINKTSNLKSKEDYMEGFITFLVVIVILFGIGTFFSGFFTVATAKAAVVQRFGKFVRVAGAGLNFKLPWIEKVAAKVDLRVQQLDVRMETKTKDNVFVAIPVSVQYHVLPDRVYEAFYKLSDPKEQIGSFVFNVILGHVPKMNLDEAFEQQNAIATAVKQELDGVMAGFGYGIVKALVTDIIPDPKVKAAMNDINAARREQEAANARGEAEKILKVKQAEAEAMSKQLQGQGIANQRKAIIDGLRESVETFKASVEGTSAKDVMTLVLLTQYFDTLKEIGASAHSNTIMMPHSPGGMVDFFDQIRNAVVLGEAVGDARGAAMTSAKPGAQG